MPFRVCSVDDKLALRLIFPRVLRYSSVNIIPITLPSRLQPNGTYRSHADVGCIPRNKEITFHISGTVREKSTFTLFMAYMEVKYVYIK